MFMEVTSEIVAAASFAGLAGVAVTDADLALVMALNDEYPETHKSALDFQQLRSTAEAFSLVLLAFSMQKALNQPVDSDTMCNLAATVNSLTGLSGVRSVITTESDAVSDDVGDTCGTGYVTSAVRDIHDILKKEGADFSEYPNYNFPVKSRDNGELEGPHLEEELLELLANCDQQEIKNDIFRKVSDQVAVAITSSDGASMHEAVVKLLPMLGPGSDLGEEKYGKVYAKVIRVLALQAARHSAYRKLQNR